VHESKISKHDTTFKKRRDKTKSIHAEVLVRVINQRREQMLLRDSIPRFSMTPMNRTDQNIQSRIKKLLVILK